MSNVDSRIVTMKFDNKQFEQGASTTMQTLEKLKTSLNFEGAKKSLSDLQGMSGKFDFSSLEGGIDKISGKFLALSTIGITALSNITTAAMNAGTQMVKSLTLDPVASGFSEYELKMGAIQTIMAGSGESLDVVNAKLGELNTYSDQTIYSFKDMTSNIGKFTNAGVSLDKSVAAIKGVANVAALSGANAEEASRSMYNFAQSISSGSVKLMDWKSIELANMATVEFKEELIKSAEAAGTLTKAGEGVWKTLEGTTVTTTKFNETLQDGWLTSEALVDTLGRYSDATTDIGARATAAATEVKTFSQLMDTLREAAGSGWATTFELLVGNFKEAKALWTNVNDVVGGAIQKSAEARNAMLTEWKAMGGRDVLLEGLTNIVHAVANILNPIKDAFREIFPRKTAQQIYDMTVAFRDFTKHLVIQPEIMDAIKSLAKGIFAIFSIIHQFGHLGRNLIIAVFDALSTGTGAASGGILPLIAKIADVISAFDAWLKEGDRLKNVLDAIAKVIAFPIKMIGELVAALFALARGDTTPFLDNLLNKFDALGPIVDKLKDKFQVLKEFIEKVTTIFDDLFGKTDAGGEQASASVDAVNAGLEKTETTLNTIGNIWDSVKSGFEKAVAMWQSFSASVGPGLKTLKDKVVEFVKGLDWFDLLIAGDIGFMAIFILQVKKFFDSILGILEGAAAIMNNAADVLEETTNTLKTMQKDIKAGIILKIAIAIGILAVSLWLLSTIDPVKLGFALGAVIGLMITLMIVMKQLMKSINAMDEDKSLKETAKASARLTLLSVALVAFAIAIAVLAVAIKILGSMNPEELKQGLVTIAGILIALVIISKGFEKAGGASEFIKIAAALLILSVALMALAATIQIYNQLDVDTLIKGLGIITGIILGLVGISFLLKQTGAEKELLYMSTALLILSFALDSLAATILIYNKMEAAAFLDGLWKIGLLIAGIIGLSMLLSGVHADRNIIILAASLILFAIALRILQPVLEMIANLSFGQLAAIVGLIGALFAILAATALLAGTEIVLFLLGVAGAIALFGLAVMAVGAGMLMFSTGLVTLAASGAAGVAVLIGMLAAVIKLIPELLKEIADGLVEFLKHIASRAQEIKDAWVEIFTAMLQGLIEIAPTFFEAMTVLVVGMLQVIIDSAPKFFEALTVILEGLLQTIIDTAPKFGEAFVTVVSTALDALRTLFPKIVETGFSMLMALLTGIKNNIYRIVTTAADIITEFLRGLGDNSYKIINQAMQTVLQFLNGLTRAIDENSAAFGKAGANLIAAIVKGMLEGMKQFKDTLGGIMGSIVDSVVDAVLKKLHIRSPSKVFIEIGGQTMEGFIIGIEGSGKGVAAAASEVAGDAIDIFKDTLSKIADAVSGEVDIQPVITPVLDLSQVRKDATAITDLITPESLSALNAYDQAALISASMMTKPKEFAAGEQPATLVQFEQNNYSPKALSSVDIYRQTRNQLSLAKEALKT